MPYITNARREVVWNDPSQIEAPGELNYVMTRYILENREKESYTYYNDMIGTVASSLLALLLKFNVSDDEHARWFVKTTKMADLNFKNVIGAYICVVLELYRRAVVPYEDDKIFENGDMEGFWQADEARRISKAVDYYPDAGE